MYLNMECEGIPRDNPSSADVVQFRFELPEKESLFIFGPRSTVSAQDDFYYLEPGGYRLDFSYLSGNDLDIALNKWVDSTWKRQCTNKGEAVLIVAVSAPAKLALPLSPIETLYLGQTALDANPPTQCATVGFPAPDPAGHHELTLIGVEFDYFGPVSGCTLAGKKLFLQPPWLSGPQSEREADTLLKTHLVTSGCIVDPKPKPTQPGQHNIPPEGAAVLGENIAYIEYFSPGLVEPSASGTARLTIIPPRGKSLELRPRGIDAPWVSIDGAATMRFFEDLGTKRLVAKIMGGDPADKLVKFSPPVANRKAVFVPPRVVLSSLGEATNVLTVSM